jgi:hypothetical protein
MQAVLQKMEIKYRPIGLVHTPFKQIEGMPIQPSGAVQIQGSVEIFPEFADGLQDIEGFSHLILLYHFHRTEAPKLLVTPFLDSRSHGVLPPEPPRAPTQSACRLSGFCSVQATFCRSRMSICWTVRPSWTSNRTRQSLTNTRRTGSGGWSRPGDRFGLSGQTTGFGKTTPSLLIDCYNLAVRASCGINFPGSSF